MKPSRRVLKLSAHFCNQLAVVGGFDFREFFRVGGQHITQTSEQRPSRARGQAAPIAAVKCLLRCGYRTVYIRLPTPRDKRPRLSGEGVNGLEPLRRRRIYPGAIDQHAMFLHRAEYNKLVRDRGWGATTSCSVRHGTRTYCLIS